jgi:serine phosphatase RsbU (regulator of sigma subunit)
MEDINYHQNAIALEPGDRVYLYTDGVTEASNINDELFGDSRLLQIMNDKMNLSLKELVDYVKEKVDTFAGEREQFDDITMLVMEYKK